VRVYLRPLVWVRPPEYGDESVPSTLAGGTGTGPTSPQVIVLALPVRRLYSFQALADDELLANVGLEDERWSPPPPWLWPLILAMPPSGVAGAPPPIVTPQPEEDHWQLQLSWPPYYPPVQARVYDDELPIIIVDEGFVVTYLVREYLPRVDAFLDDETVVGTPPAVDEEYPFLVWPPYPWRTTSALFLEEEPIQSPPTLFGDDTAWSVAVDPKRWMYFVGPFLEQDDTLVAVVAATLEEEYWWRPMKMQLALPPPAGITDDDVISVPATVRFRKTLQEHGTHEGGRQTHRWVK